MTNNTLSKLLKIQELIDRGVGGEVDAAKNAFARLIKSHNLSEDDLNSINLTIREFKYSNSLERKLLFQIVKMVIASEVVYYKYDNLKQLGIKLNHLDFISVETCYEYFRRHMKAQYKIHVTEVRKSRELELKKEYGADIANTREFRSDIRKFTKDLQTLFFSKYIIESKFYEESQITHEKVKYNANALDYMSSANVEGGNYHTQVTTGLYLE